MEYARRCTMCGTWDAKRRWATRDEAMPEYFECEYCGEDPPSYEVGVLEEPYTGARLLEALGGADLMLGWSSAGWTTNGELLKRLGDAGFDVRVYHCGEKAFTVVVFSEGRQIFASMEDSLDLAFVEAYDALVGSTDSWGSPT